MFILNIKNTTDLHTFAFHKEVIRAFPSANYYRKLPLISSVRLIHVIIKRQVPHYFWGKQKTDGN